MSLLVLTLNPNEPLVIGDADVIIKIVETRGKYVKITVDADVKTPINRGSVFLGKKMLPEYDYISMPLYDLWKENPDLMSELLEQTAQDLHLENIDYENLPEKSKRIFSMVNRDLYMKVVELFLAKFLYVNKLEFNAESVELFKNDFLKSDSV